MSILREKHIIHIHKIHVHQLFVIDKASGQQEAVKYFFFGGGAGSKLHEDSTAP